jgi:prevent-host-death family protein
MGSVNLKEARARLSDLVRTVEHGESVTITRRGKIVARLVPPKTAPSCKKAPDLSTFRASLKGEGKPLSQIVIENRRKVRH